MLDQYEEDAKFFYIEQKGEEEEMNKFVLNIIQNLKISVERIYIRIEMPEYEFSLGVLLPSIQVSTTDKDWNVVEKVENPEILHKSIQVQNISIFLDYNKDTYSLDDIYRDNENIVAKPYDGFIKQHV